MSGSDYDGQDEAYANLLETVAALEAELIDKQVRPHLHSPGIASLDDALEHLTAACNALHYVRHISFINFTKEDEEAIRMPHSVYEKFNGQIARLEEDIRMEMARQDNLLALINGTLEFYKAREEN